MKKTLVGGVTLAALLLAGGLSSASAQAAYPKDWDRRIGDDPVTRFFNYYKLEWGHDVAPPSASLPGRKGWPTTPQAIPPYPFTEWPYGGATPIGVSRPNAVDSPFMVSIAHTPMGKWMNDAHIQVYGWVNVGGNISTNTTRPGGNWPAAYTYTPNTIQLDQAVLYIERVPDTVQKSHFDWGFRISGIYGENYRYTTAYGVASYQLLGHNLVNGYDFPMMYWEGYWPLMEGLLVRVGRFISIPDIEAQLAPNNYMYSHSLTYTFDNYTNTGIQFTQAITKNWMLQFGVALGTDSAPWNYRKTLNNPFPNPVYPSATFLKDPGNMPSYTLGARWTSNSGYDSLYVVGDALNTGQWGYNNLQWYGVTWYHKFNEKWHFSWETYTLSQRNVLSGNPNNAVAQNIIAQGGYPFSAAATGQGINFNAPGFAQCSDPNALTCTARVITSLVYLNYKITPMDNISWRAEYYHDEQGQRTGVATRYSEFGIGLQHWFSPQIVIRPEVTWYKSWNAPAFNGNSNQPNNSQPGFVSPTKSEMWMAAMDLTVHF